jgi:hypothetical protein
MTDAILAVCPDSQWRLIVALSRYGGLRCPSEHLALTWGDVDLERGRLRVRSPKTAHHQGKDKRVVPLFPELRSHLEASYAELVASADANPDFDPEANPLSAQAVVTRYRQAKQNLRTTFTKIIKRAGLTPWPKLFHNLRSSRQTELEERFPTHVVCGWLGNSTKVARDHYLQTTDDHFDRACATPCASNASHGVASDCDPPKTPGFSLHSFAQSDPMRVPGLEAVANHRKKRTSGTACATSCATTVTDRELQALVEAWPRLGVCTQAAILGVFRAVRG